MKERVLVTGAQGFIGRYLVRELLRSNQEGAVLGIGRSPVSQDRFNYCVVKNGTSQRARLTPELLESSSDARYIYREIDVTDALSMARFLAEFKPNVIIHLASTPREEGPQRLINGNIQGVRSMVDACRASGAGVKRIVLGSSGAVYGIPTELPLRETTPCLPADAYAASKLAAEHFARILCREAGIELIIGRIFNVAGPGQKECHVCGRIASELAAIKHGHQAAVLSIGGLSATRDYVDVRDVSTALAILARKGIAGEIYNIGSGVESSVQEVLEVLIELSGLSGRIKIACHLDPPQGVMRHFANLDKTSAAGVRTLFDLTSSLKGVLLYYLS